MRASAEGKAVRVLKMSPHDSGQHAYEISERGVCYFQAGRYVEAGQDYRKAVDLAGNEDPNRFIYLFNFANVLQLMWRFDEAAPLYEQILGSNAPSPPKGSVQVELNRLSLARQQKAINANDGRLYATATQLIPMYPRMNRPVNLAWVEESRKSMAWITRIQDEHNTPKDNRLSSFSGWEAIGHVIGGEHWIFIKTGRWARASDEQLRGLVSHELVHAEMKDTLPPEAFLEGKAAENLIHDERLTDRISIYKGFGEELLASREIMEPWKSRHQSGLMSSGEIRHILGSMDEMTRRAEFQSWLARSLAEKLGGDNRLVQEEFFRAKRLWEPVAKSRRVPARAKQELETAIRHSEGVSRRT